MKQAVSLLLCILLLCGCTAASAQRYTASFLDVFDTASQIVIYSDDQKEADRAAQLIHRELVYYHQLFDQYHHTPGVNGVYVLNREAAKAPVQVDDPLFSLLCLGKSMYYKTDGKVNIAMGSVLSLWHEAREHGLAQPAAAALPDMDALKQAALHTDPQSIVLDSENQTVFFADPELKLDLGAVAKGYAVERVADLLAEEGLSGILLSIGGNVRTVGCRPDGTAFPVGVQNPDLAAEQQHIAVLGLSNASLVTSGSYQRYYTVSGKQYHHIIDPDTLMPSAYVWAVSVVTEDSGLADALSTALFNMPIEAGKALIANYPGTEAVWVLDDGTKVYSDGFEALMQ